MTRKKKERELKKKQKQRRTCEKDTEIQIKSTPKGKIGEIPENDAW